MMGVKLPGVNPRELTQTVFKEQGGEELLKYKAEHELTSISIANDFIEQANGEPITAFLGVEERAAQLTRGIVSLVDGDLEGYYAQEYARRRCSCEPGDVLPYVDMDPAEWSNQKLRWADLYDADADPEDIAANHVKSAFGVSIDEFTREVVSWPDERDADIVGRFLAGDRFDRDYRVFTGHRTAHEGLEVAYRTLYE